MRRRRSRLHRARSAEPVDHRSAARSTRCNVETGESKNVTPEVNLPTPARHTWTQPAGVLAGGSARALFRRSVSVQDDRRRRTLDADQRRHHARRIRSIRRTSTRRPPPTSIRTAASGGVIYTIAPSPLRAPLLWIGTDDGLHPSHAGRRQDVAERDAARADAVEQGRDDGRVAFRRRTKRTPPSIAIASTDNEPYIYRTKDGGKTWQKITSGLPAGVYMQTVKEDPKRRGLLVAGTELGVFVSFNDGDDWQSLQLNLPPTSNARPRVPRQRPHRRDARPRVLGARRHQRAAADRS